MAPPAKRRKRNVLPSSSSSSSEELQLSKPVLEMTDLISSSPPESNDTRSLTSAKANSQVTIKSSTKSLSRAKTSNHPHHAAPSYLPSPGKASKSNGKSASSSPEKTKRKVKAEEKVKSGDIFTFFTKQAQRQQAEAKSKPKPPSQVCTGFEAEDDIISDGDDIVDVRAQSASLVGQTARKRARGSQSLKNGDGDAPSGSQVFFKKPSRIAEIKLEEDLKPWAERFGPVNLDELAVHKKKVADVRTWLEEVMNGRMRQRLLLLKGAAGTGKTTTVQLLAKAMNCDVLEWRNPVGSVSSADGYLSMSAQFEEFMGRGGRYGQLDIFSTVASAPVKQEPKPLDRRKNIILIEEFPNTFTRSSTTLQSFRSSILQYLTSNTPPLSMMQSNNFQDSITPVVMIISETLLTTSSASADSFTAHRLLGPEILQHPGVGIIEFNAIAPTLLAKALEVVVQKESRKSGRRKTPGPLVLKKLGEIGDIRSAIGSLEFLCLRGDVDGDWGAKVAFGKTKKSSQEVPLTTMESQSLELVTRREASLGIFHAVGKVVYNKRDERIPSLLAGKDVEQLADFMSYHSRPRRSQVIVNELIDETGTDTQTFVAALHENYILSCDAPATSYELSSLDHVNGCIDALSDCDLLCPSWDGSLNSTGFGGGVGGRGTGGDILRQDEMSFQIAVRGVLFWLPYPVKRKALAAGGFRTGKGGDAHKMFYPTSLKLWRMKEEIESLVDLWVTKLMKGGNADLNLITAGAAAFAKSNTGTVESWKSAPSTLSNTKKPNPSNGSDPAPLLSIGASARKEMLLERLPYMAAIARAKRTSSSSLVIRELEKITTFHGIGGQSEDPADEENDTGTPGEEWATDKSGDRTGKSPMKKGMVMRGRGVASGLPIPHLKQKLVLSDDDIEDD